MSNEYEYNEELGSYQLEYAKRLLYASSDQRLKILGWWAIAPDSGRHIFAHDVETIGILKQVYYRETNVAVKVAILNKLGRQNHTDAIDIPSNAIYDPSYEVRMHSFLNLGWATNHCLKRYDDRPSLKEWLYLNLLSCTRQLLNDAYPDLRQKVMIEYGNLTERMKMLGYLR